MVPGEVAWCLLQPVRLPAVKLSPRKAWTLGVGGFLGVLLIAVGLLWDAPGGECLTYASSRDLQESVRICIDYAANLSWLPPALTTAGIIVAMATLALALAWWGGGKASA